MNIQVKICRKSVNVNNNKQKIKGNEMILVTDIYHYQIVTSIE